MIKNILFLICISGTALAGGDLSLINVNGVAEKYVDPNMSVISIETYGRAEQAKLAQERQANEFQKVKKVIEKFKVKKEDFITENMSLNPEYKYDEKTQSNRTTGFKVSHRLKVVLRSTENTGAFLDAITSSGKIDNSGLIIESIGWDYDKRKVISEQLIQDAVADARRKADRLAAAAGVKIKSVQTINYSESSAPSVRNEVFMAKSVRSFSDSAPTELGSGAVKILTEVSLQYRIE